MRIIALFLLCLPMGAGACPEPPRTVKRPPVVRTVRRENGVPVYTF